MPEGDAGAYAAHGMPLPPMVRERRSKERG